VDVTSEGPPVGRYDEEESADAATPADSASPADSAASAFDVAPRTGSSSAGQARGARRWLAAGAIAVLLVALGVVLFNGLNDAALFYFNVDEALERQDSLGDDRFRMQGNVIDGSISETTEGIAFVLTYGDAEVQVRHAGDPPELFSPDIPVIIEGRFAGQVFESDEILIRHDNTYTEEHEDRLQEANDDAERRARDAG
jgi:cytochrome c-type biogenesis protein CcmE